MSHTWWRCVILQCLCLCPVGLEDMVLSALVQEQVEGITPDAIALMTPKKMAVCFTNYVNAINLSLTKGKEISVMAEFDFSAPLLRSWPCWCCFAGSRFSFWACTKLYILFIQDLQICPIFFLIIGIHALFIKNNEFWRIRSRSC